MALVDDPSTVYVPRTAALERSTIYRNDATFEVNATIIRGNDNNITGHNNTVIGDRNNIIGNSNTVRGYNNYVEGLHNSAQRKRGNTRIRVRTPRIDECTNVQWVNHSTQQLAKVIVLQWQEGKQWRCSTIHVWFLPSSQTFCFSLIRRPDIVAQVGLRDSATLYYHIEIHVSERGAIRLIPFDPLTRTFMEQWVFRIRESPLPPPLEPPSAIQVRVKDVDSTPNSSPSSEPTIRVRTAPVEEPLRIVQHPNCVICLSTFFTTICVPCAHYCLCDGCRPKTSHCPICRAPVSMFLRVFEAGYAS